MGREIGTNGNATFRAYTDLAPGCHQYWFVETDAAGVRRTYATTGSLTVGSGGASCATDYVSARTAAICGA
jgi:hypothetical protein